ncbi:MAG: Uma2 family endonuclease [Pyrinomonadaceae bacterium]|nr:Uma2 family endonuclease [Pyrinomonadaceae bacterium]
MPIPKLRRDKNHLYTIEEYLKIDRASQERYEYYDGEIRLMAGESGNHGDISVNISSELRFQLKGKNCRVRSKDSKIQTGGLNLDTKSKKGVFSYPDIVVICGKVEYHDKVQDIVLNPKVIIEVLSDSTEVYDRNNKFTRYKLFNPTLTDYILVSQDKPQVEHFIRQDDGGWKVFFYLGLDQSFTIEYIECTLNLVEIYDRIEFPKEAFEFIEEVRNG